MATITLQPAQTIDIDLNKIVLTKTTDIPSEFLITASVEGVWRDIVLWKGQEQYAAAGNWTNETIVAQVSAVISSGNIQFA